MNEAKLLDNEWHVWYFGKWFHSSNHITHVYEFSSRNSRKNSSRSNVACRLWQAEWTYSELHVSRQEKLTGQRLNDACMVDSKQAYSLFFFFFDTLYTVCVCIAVQCEEWTLWSVSPLLLLVSSASTSNKKKEQIFSSFFPLLWPAYNSDSFHLKWSIHSTHTHTQAVVITINSLWDCALVSHISASSFSSSSLLN